MSSKYDLAKEADFARATFSQTNNILQRLIPNKNEWVIEEASYNEIPFLVFESNTGYQASLPSVQDAGGRRKAKYMYPYIDGQTTDDLGRKPDQFTFNIIFHGSNYREGFKQLFREFNKPQPGTLVHPVRGVVTCGLEDYTIMHEHSMRNAMTVQVVMIEHNFSTPDLENLVVDSSFKSFIVRAIEFFSDLTTLQTRIEGGVIFVQELRDDINALIESVKNRYARNLSNQNALFNSGNGGDARPQSTSAIIAQGGQVTGDGEITQSYNDIPLLLPVNQGGLLNEDGTFESNIPQTATPGDPFATLPVDVLSEQTTTALAIDEIEKDLNDIRLLINNVIALISSVAAGALEYNQGIIDLKGAGIALQECFERGKASSRADIIDYVTPRLMNIHEICFANGVDVNRAIEIELLNTELLSVNCIEKGTTLRVPV